MRLIQDDRTIERFALGSETGFTIKAVGKAFRILSSNLYQDKIRAIIRELACNAYDAHVAAGWPERPFQVHLPNPLEPFFAVRDSGVGLSPDEMTTVYTTYFESTKTASNAYIGALGLGSKAPFSYVDSFTVCSWHQGTCYRYAAFVSENGMPVISLLSQVPTDAANGLEVSLVVREADDFPIFAAKAQSVLKWFEVRPEVVGGADFRFPEPEMMLQGDGWHITTQRHAPFSEALAIMGNVAYPINGSAITGLNHTTQRICKTGLCIRFPIGSLDVTAGRESLSYDPLTLATLEQRAEAIAADAPARFQHMIDACTSRYAAHNLYGRLIQSGIADALLGPSRPTMRFRGEIIAANAVTIDLEAYPAVTVESYCDSKRPHRKQVFSATVSSTLYIPAVPTVDLVINDRLKLGDLRNRIAHHRKINPTLALFLLIGASDQIASLMARLDGFSMRDASALDRAPLPRNRAAPVQVMRLTHRALSSYRHQFDSDCWEPATIDPAQGGLFIQRRGHLVLANKQASSQFLQILRHARAADLLDYQTSIYGFNATMLRCYADKPGWINLPDHLHTVIMDRMTRDVDLLRLMQVQHLQSMHLALVQNRMHVIRLGRVLPPEHPMAEFARNWDMPHHMRMNVKSDTLRLLCDLLRIPLPDTVCAMQQQWQSFRRTYPLLSILECENRLLPPQIEVDHLAAYVQWIDQCGGTVPQLSPLAAPHLQLT